MRWKPRTAQGRFALHYVEMVVSMLVGMGVLWPIWIGVFAVIGQSQLGDRGDVDALTMAVDMVIGMAAWMRFRGHRWVPIAEMSGAMVLPFVVLLVPYWTGDVSGDTLMMGGHTLMFVTMLLAMLWRRDEYTADHADHAAQPVGSSSRARSAT
jgi:hypothetical protein